MGRTISKPGEQDRSHAARQHNAQVSLSYELLLPHRRVANSAGPAIDDAKARASGAARQAQGFASDVSKQGQAKASDLKKQANSQAQQAQGQFKQTAQANGIKA